MGKPEIFYRTSLDIRANNDTDGFSGHAASFNSVDSYGTAFLPGAFKKTISERKDKIPVLWNHNPDVPVGKHLDMREDDLGLFVDVGIADDGADGSVLLKRLRFGVPLGLSFGFETIKSRRYEEGDKLDFSNAPEFYKTPEGREWVRVIEEVRYWESSPVTFPANQNSTIDDIRSAHLEQQAGFLTSLLEDLRAGKIGDTDARHTLLQDIVAASQQRAEPKPDPSAGTTPLDPAIARRDREFLLVAVAARCGMTVEQLTCVA